MRKFIIMFILILGTFLVSCGKEDNNDEENLPKDEAELLLYYEYLNENNPLVTIKIQGFGEMELELFPEVAKVSVDNFLKYILDEAYTNSSFHRIIEGFMIQGGIVENTYPPIIGEFSSNGVTNDLKHYRGVISMARTIIPNSATSQFFIVHKDSPHLNGSYASFGGLISGFDVLDKIAEVKTNYNDAPLEEVVITKITVNLRGYSRNE